MSDWLEDLKAGDKVFMMSGGWSNIKTLTTVERLTKTQIITNTNTKYRKDNGYQVGASSFNKSHLEQATVETILAFRLSIKRNKLIYKLKETKWLELPVTVLQNIDDIIVEHYKQEEASKKIIGK